MQKTDPLCRSEIVTAMRRVAAGALLALLCALPCAGAEQAQTSAASVATSHAALRQRVQALSSSFADVAGLRFFVFEASALLDRAEHENARNDASGFAAAAEHQALLLIERLEAARAHPESRPDAAFGVWQRTLLQSFSSDAMRPDLAQRLDALFASSSLSCSAPEVAIAYGYLVQARNAHAELGWRYADPYFRLTELHLTQADALAKTCVAGTVPVRAP